MKNTITIYACGGSGLNIGQLVEAKFASLAADIVPHSDIIVYYIDTSESNVRDKKVTNLYLFDGLDGSGGLRVSNKDEIADYVPDILAKFAPGDLSIVINSTSGGSGSVIGPMIASKLLEREKLVISVAIMSSESKNHLINTVDVLETLEGISVHNERVLPVILCDNNQSNEDSVNNTVFASVYSLSVLFSGGLLRLDSADLDNWINFNKVTSHPIGAVLLDIVSNDTSLEKNDVICSIASIVKNNNEVYKDFVEYKTTGIFNTGDKNSLNNIHFALIDGPIQRAHKRHKEMLEEKISISSSRPKRTSIASTTTARGFKF